MHFVQWPKIDELEINEVTKVLKSGKLNFGLEVIQLILKKNSEIISILIIVLLSLMVLWL